MSSRSSKDKSLNSSKIDNLERTILKIGSELYNIKETVNKNNHLQKKLVESFRSIKMILNEKGLVTESDLEGVINLESIDHEIESIHDLLNDSYEAPAKKISH